MSTRFRRVETVSTRDWAKSRSNGIWLMDFDFDYDTHHMKRHFTDRFAIAHLSGGISGSTGTGPGVI